MDFGFRKVSSLIALSFCLLGLFSCGLAPASDEELLRQSFESIKKHDWDAYMKLTVTRADFDLRKLNMSGPIREKQSYAGHMKIEERERQKDDFERACRGGKHQIDFSTTQFAGADKLDSFMAETVTGIKLPARVYAIRTGEKIQSHEDNHPFFVILDWDEHPRILNLVFTQEPDSRLGE